MRVWRGERTRRDATMAMTEAGYAGLHTLSEEKQDANDEWSEASDAEEDYDGGFIYGKTNNTTSNKAVRGNGGHRGDGGTAAMSRREVTAVLPKLSHPRAGGGGRGGGSGSGSGVGGASSPSPPHRRNSSTMTPTTGGSRPVVGVGGDVKIASVGVAAVSGASASPPGGFKLGVPEQRMSRSPNAALASSSPPPSPPPPPHPYHRFSLSPPSSPPRYQQLQQSRSMASLHSLHSNHSYALSQSKSLPPISTSFSSSSSSAFPPVPLEPHQILSPRAVAYAELAHKVAAAAAAASKHALLNNKGAGRHPKSFVARNKKRGPRIPSFMSRAFVDRSRSLTF